jgi:hypothetical protein
MEIDNEINFAICSRTESLRRVVLVLLDPCLLELLRDLSDIEGDGDLVPLSEDLDLRFLVETYLDDGLDVVS